MAEQHRDKDQQNYLIDQARAIRDEIEVSVLGPSGVDTPPCAEAWPTAKLIAGLLHRVEALERDRRTILDSSSRLRVGLDAAQPPQPNYPAKPDSSLVERVAFAITGDSDGLINWKPEARAAIREVAAWLQEQKSYGHGWAAITLEQEAER